MKPQKPQMTSNDPKRPQLTSKEPKNESVGNTTNETFKNKSKKVLEGGVSQAEKFEISDQHLNKITIQGVN